MNKVDQLFTWSIPDKGNWQRMEFPKFTNISLLFFNFQYFEQFTLVFSPLSQYSFPLWNKFSVSYNFGPFGRNRISSRIKPYKFKWFTEKEKKNWHVEINIYLSISYFCIKIKAFQNCNSELTNEYSITDVLIQRTVFLTMWIRKAQLGTENRIFEA